MSRDSCNKEKYQEKFRYRIPNNYRETLLLDKKNRHAFWDDTIDKWMMTLEKLRVLQLYLPKNKLEKKYGW